MKRFSRMRHAPWLTGVAALVTLSGGDQAYAFTPDLPRETNLEREAELLRFIFNRDRILGTSLDLLVDSPRPEDARRTEAAVLEEIGRLNGILSTYDPASEISRVRRGEDVRSPELAELLALYDSWKARTGGLIEVNMAEVIRLWKAAAQEGRLPDRDSLARAARQPLAYNVDALGKGYVIDRAVAVARRFAPAGLLDLGGDIRVWGDRDWLIGVADPARPADNAAPLRTATLRESAIATSGGYARFVSIDGQRYSHLIDPRTQWALPVGGSATAVARDAVTANAFATAAAIAGPTFIESQAGLAGALVVDAAGQASEAGSLATVQPVQLQQSAAETADAAWPEGFEVQIEVNFRDFGGGGGFGGGFGPPGGGRGGRGGAKRPFMAVWIENADGQVVRNLTLWGRDQRYIPDMSTWWNKIRRNWNIVQAVSRATRPAGSYTLDWDGRDDAGNPVATGAYKVFVEINREHGGHVVQSADLACFTEATTAELKATSESGATVITYGPGTD